MLVCDLNLWMVHKHIKKKNLKEFYNLIDSSNQSFWYSLDFHVSCFLSNSGSLIFGKFLITWMLYPSIIQIFTSFYFLFCSPYNTNIKGSEIKIVFIFYFSPKNKKREMSVWVVGNEREEMTLSSVHFLLGYLLGYLINNL